MCNYWVMFEGQLWIHCTTFTLSCHSCSCVNKPRYSRDGSHRTRDGLLSWIPIWRISALSRLFQLKSCLGNLLWVVPLKQTLNLVTSEVSSHLNHTVTHVLSELTFLFFSYIYIAVDRVMLSNSTLSFYTLHCSYPEEQIMDVSELSYLFERLVIKALIKPMIREEILWIQPENNRWWRCGVYALTAASLSA